MQPMTSFNSSYASFCPLLITFANSLNPNQDQQNVDPWLWSKPFDILEVLLK